MRFFLYMLSLLLLSSGLTSMDVAGRDRLYVLNTSDFLFMPLRKRILFSRRYLGRYYKQFPFRALRMTEYRLKEGETLYDVASALGTSVDSIATSSGIKFIYGTKSGQMLRIPDFQGIVYRAKRKVTVRYLALRYGIPEHDIRRFNGYRSRFLYRGQSLFLPGAHMTALEQALFYGTAFACPLPRAVLTSRFGLRRDPITGTMAFHGGIDLAAPQGTPVTAAHDGVIEYTGWAGGYGNIVVVRHAFGYRTVYGHLSRISVRRGFRIGRGKLLGRVGSTGYSTGPHLHFEIRHYSRHINPVHYAALDHRQGGRWVRADR